MKSLLILFFPTVWQVLIDNEKVESGDLESDWDFLPAKTIKDPEAKKPEDWDDRAKIDDPEDTKPADWDVAEHIADPEAKKPEDWDDEMDGEWEPAMIDNPAFKGEWKPKQIDNPAYKVHRIIFTNPITVFHSPFVRNFRVSGSIPKSITPNTPLMPTLANSTSPALLVSICGKWRLVPSSTTFWSLMILRKPKRYKEQFMYSKRVVFNNAIYFRLVINSGLPRASPRRKWRKLRKRKNERRWKKRPS